MKFEQVYQAFKDGKRIRRAKESDNLYYKFDKESECQLMLTTSRMLADDWEIEPKTVTISLIDLTEAYKRFCSKNRSRFSEPSVGDIAFELGLLDN